MRFLILFIIIGPLFGFVLGRGDDGCSTEFNCNENNPTNSESYKDAWKLKSSCNSHYGGFPQLETKAQNLAMQHFTVSMQNLLLASRFSYWKTERPGFKNLFSTLSDTAFADGIKILEHSALRGGRLIDFNVPMVNTKYELSELEALGKALDLQKLLANETNIFIHSAKSNQDPEFVDWISDEISEKQSVRIHHLAGHINNLGEAIGTARANGRDPAFPIFLYDSEILSK